jgi:hypothetical protein
MKQTIAIFLANLFVVGTLFARTTNAQSTTSQPDPQQPGLQLQGLFKRQPTDKVDTTEVSNLTGLSEAVAKAIVWNNYWFGYWPDKVSNLMQTRATLKVLPVGVEKEQAVYVFVDEIHSVLHCYWDGAYFVQWVDDYEDPVLSGGPRLEDYAIDKRRYGVGRQTVSVTLAPSLLGVLAFGEFDAIKVNKVEQLFNEYILTAEFFKEIKAYRSPKLVHAPIRIRVGNFTKDSSWIYYQVEGMEYLETIQLDSTGKRLVYLDSYSFKDPPHMWDYPHAIERIKQNGAWFVVKNGKFRKE